MNETTPFYDPLRTFEENYDRGPFGLFADESFSLESPTVRQSFLGYEVNLPFGIPAGPLLHRRFITAAWRWGFAISTYKTVRSDTFPTHPFPNIIKVKGKDFNIHPGDTVVGDFDIQTVNIEQDGITNSFAVPSKPFPVWQQDVTECMKKAGKGNVLILSFMGTKRESMSREQFIQDFSHTCELAKQTEAHVLEVNLSCPNFGAEGLVCNDVRTSTDILEALHTAKGNVPLLVKIGYFPKESQDDLIQLLTAINRYAEGVVAINTVSAKVVDGEGKQKLPGSPVRLMSGTCGASIRWAGLEMASRIVTVKNQQSWNNFAVVGVGGVITAQHYQQYKQLGVDAVQSAAGAMWRPRLAQQIAQSQG